MNKTDTVYMKKALALAARAKGRTSPNPMVGAVVVKGGNVIGTGYHKKAGTPHAEAIALKQADADAKNATLYVTLEPCCHTEKKTPPCTREIIRSGVKRVVIAMTDPNPKVSGNGIAELQAAGIEVHVGLMEAGAQRLNEAFSKFITTREPFVTLKMAQSLDGKIATARGESKWITGPEARKRVHRLRNEVDALLVGIGTIRKDDPSLDCRIRGGRSPYRIVLDSRLRIPMSAKVLQHGDGKTIVVTTPRAGARKMKHLQEQGHTVIVVNSGKAAGTRRRAGANPGTDRIHLKRLMKKLGTMDITHILIEGGSSVAAAALSEKIVDKVIFFVAPSIIGGTDSVPSVGGTSPGLLKNAHAIKNMTVTKVGNDICIEGYVR